MAKLSLKLRSPDNYIEVSVINDWEMEMVTG
jgi:hypothetical protein